MRKRVNWDKVEELVQTIKEQGLSFAEGALMFGIPVWQLYELNRRKKRAVEGKCLEPETPIISDNVKEGEEQGTTQGIENGVAGNNSDFFDKSPLPEEVQRLIIQHHHIGVRSTYLTK